MNPFNPRSEQREAAVPDPDAAAISAAEALRNEAQETRPRQSHNQSERQNDPASGSPASSAGPKPVERIGLENFASTAFALLPSLDLDGDGLIEDSELRQAMDNPQLKGWKAQVIAGLHVEMDTIKNLSDDNPRILEVEAGLRPPRPTRDEGDGRYIEYDEEAGISEADLRALEKTRNALNDLRVNAQDALDWSRQNFALADTNADGFLQFEEINPLMSGAQQHPWVGKFLHENFDKIKLKSRKEDATDSPGWYSFKGISSVDISKLHYEAFNGPESRMFGSIDIALTKAGDAQMTNGSR